MDLYKLILNHTCLAGRHMAQRNAHIEIETFSSIMPQRGKMFIETVNTK
jgi:hypothetical protein